MKPVTGSGVPPKHERTLSRYDVNSARSAKLDCLRAYRSCPPRLVHPNHRSLPTVPETSFVVTSTAGVCDLRHDRSTSRPGLQEDALWSRPRVIRSLHFQLRPICSIWQRGKGLSQGLADLWPALPKLHGITARQGDGRAHKMIRTILPLLGLLAVVLAAVVAIISYCRDIRIRAARARVAAPSGPMSASN
jgi:hypothetical protein